MGTCFSASLNGLPGPHPARSSRQSCSALLRSCGLTLCFLQLLCGLLVVRIESQSFGEALFGFSVAAQLHEEDSQLTLNLGVPGAQVGGASEVCHGVVELPLLGEKHAKIEVAHGRVGKRLQAGLKVL